VRIAYVVSLFPKLSETFILREVLELKNRGHEITIVSLKRDAEPIVHEEARALVAQTLYPDSVWRIAGAVLYYMMTRPAALLSIVGRVVSEHTGHPSALLKSMALIPETLHVSRKLRERGVERLHAHWATYPALAAWIISRLEQIPYSVTGHAHDLFLPNPMLATKVRDADFFATISEFNRALLIQRCGPEALRKLRLVRCGLPLAEFPFSPARPAHDPPLIVSVGRLVDYKGFDVLLRACARLKERGRRTRCTILGDGPERARLEALRNRLALQDCVTLGGERKQNEVARLMAAADLFVLASVPGHDGQQDGIPIVLMEAMALGVPVVSSKLSGIPELVMDNRTGLLVAPGDGEHLASAIERMLGDPELAERLRRAARDLIEKEFDLKHSVDQLCDEFARSVPQTRDGRRA
jgi:glycosyltransferase involved in cell wall biosynthesis